MSGVAEIARGLIESYSASRAIRIVSDQDYAADVLLDRIQWCIWAEATRDEAVAVIDGMSEATEFDDVAVAVVVVPRGISNQDVQQVIDAAFRPHLLQETSAS